MLSRSHSHAACTELTSPRLPDHQSNAISISPAVRRHDHKLLHQGLHRVLDRTCPYCTARVAGRRRIRTHRRSSSARKPAAFTTATAPSHASAATGTTTSFPRNTASRRLPKPLRLPTPPSLLQPQPLLQHPHPRPPRHQHLPRPRTHPRSRRQRRRHPQPRPSRQRRANAHPSRLAATTTARQQHHRTPHIQQRQHHSRLRRQSRHPHPRRHAPVRPPGRARPRPADARPPARGAAALQEGPRGRRDGVLGAELGGAREDGGQDGRPTVVPLRDRNAHGAREMVVWQVVAVPLREKADGRNTLPRRTLSFFFHPSTRVGSGRAARGYSGGNAACTIHYLRGWPFASFSLRKKMAFYQHGDRGYDKAMDYYIMRRWQRYLPARRLARSKSTMQY